MLQQVLFSFNHISIDISNSFDIISLYIFGNSFNHLWYCC